MPKQNLKTKVKLTRKQISNLENLLIKANRQPSKEIAKYVEIEGLRKVFRCQKCYATNWLYPHVLHMEKEHGVINYFKTLHELFID